MSAEDLGRAVGRVLRKIKPACKRVVHVLTVAVGASVVFLYVAGFAGAFADIAGHPALDRGLQTAAWWAIAWWVVPLGAVAAVGLPLALLVGLMHVLPYALGALGILGIALLACAALGSLGPLGVVLSIFGLFFLLAMIEGA